MYLQRPDFHFETTKLHSLVMSEGPVDGKHAAVGQAGDGLGEGQSLRLGSSRFVSFADGWVHQLQCAGFIVEDDELDLLLVPYGVDPAGDTHLRTIRQGGEVTNQSPGGHEPRVYCSTPGNPTTLET